MTTGTDNSLKQWIVDNLDGTPRVLRSRSGHKKPPLRIRYRCSDTTVVTDGATAEAHELLSAGADCQLRMFHAVIDKQNRELSQGDIVRRARKFDVSVDSLRLPPVVDFAMSDRRIGQWCNVVTAHAGLPLAYMWDWEKKRVGKHVLQLPALQGSSKRAQQTVTATCISACGNYAIIGGSGGTIAVFNMQSGIPRGTVPKRASISGALSARAVSRPAPHSNPIAQAEAFRATRAPRMSMARSIALGLPGLQVKDASAGAGAGTPHNGTTAALREAHAGQITGLAVDALNKLIVSVGADQQLKVWDLDARKLLWTVDAGSGIAQLALHRDAGLIAVALDDWSVAIYDIVARRRVRKFAGHHNRITDIAFSMDARWLVSASMDCCVRIWDLPTARCVDWLQFETAVTSVALSPTAEFMATSHVDLGTSRCCRPALTSSHAAVCSGHTPMGQPHLLWRGRSRGSP